MLISRVLLGRKSVSFLFMRVRKIGWTGHKAWIPISLQCEIGQQRWAECRGSFNMRKVGVGVTILDSQIRKKIRWNKSSRTSSFLHGDRSCNCWRHVQEIPIDFPVVLYFLAQNFKRIMSPAAKESRQ